MKNNIIALIIGCLLLQVGTVSATSKTLQAKVNIVGPLGIVKNTPLEFGEIILNGRKGLVRVTTSNERFVTDEIKIRGRFSPAEFGIVGDSNNIYQVEIKGQTVSQKRSRHKNLRLENEFFLYRFDGDEFIIVTDFKIFSRNTGEMTTTGQFNSRGKDNLKIGATLHIPLDLPEGKYEGDLTININY